jgi:N-acetyltransferase 10
MSSSTRKKVDPRVRGLVEECARRNHRSFFVMIGDNAKNQLVNLNVMMSKINEGNQLAQKAPILWCYKKELGFSSNNKVRQKEMKKKIAMGKYDPNVEDPFELFLSSREFRFCYYRESENILGKTFSMCILQDFEALTPNLLCRTLETVRRTDKLDSLDFLY